MASTLLEKSTHPVKGKFAMMDFHEPEYLLSYLEKMITTFFRISLLIWAFLMTLYNRTKSRCSRVNTGLTFSENYYHLLLHIPSTAQEQVSSTVEITSNLSRGLINFVEIDNQYYEIIVKFFLLFSLSWILS